MSPRRRRPRSRLTATALVLISLAGASALGQERKNGDGDIDGAATNDFAQASEFIGIGSDDEDGGEDAGGRDEAEGREGGGQEAANDERAGAGSGAEGEEIDGVDEDEERKRREELEQVVDQLNAFDEWISDAEGRLARLQRNLKQSDGRLSAAMQRKRVIDSNIKATNADLERLAKEQARLEEQRTAQALAFSRQVTEAHRLGSADLVKILLNEDDPRDYDRLVRYHQYLVRARARKLGEYRETLRAIDAAQLARYVAIARLEDARGELGDTLSDIEKEHGERQRLISQINAELKDKMRQRELLEEGRTRLIDLLAELDRKKSEAISFDPHEPIWPVSGELVGRFGQQRSGGQLRWEGLYFTAPQGAEVRAVANGRVIFADWLRGFGQLTIIDHGERQLSLYGHTDVLYKKPGDLVVAGELIATAGQSGGQESVGLYFEVRSKGEPVDPEAWLRDRVTQVQAPGDGGQGQ